MTTTAPILSYSTPAHLPTSGHARISFWTGLLSFPFIYLLIVIGLLFPVAYLPNNKTGVLLLCLQTLLLFIGPLSAVVYGISALLGVHFTQPPRHGTSIAWAGLALGTTILLLIAIL